MKLYKVSVQGALPGSGYESLSTPSPGKEDGVAGELASLAWERQAHPVSVLAVGFGHTAASLIGSRLW